MGWELAAETPDRRLNMGVSASRPVRLVARLDIKRKNLIKGIRFEGLRVVGSPNERARHYYAAGADELLYMDAVASLYERNSLAGLVAEVVQDVFIPITVGGGIRSVSDVRTLLRAGADKVALNTAAIRRPELVTEIAEHFGSQCVVLSVEAKSTSAGKWEAYIDGGREKTGRDVFEWVSEGVEMGAGEVLVTSVDRDGTEKGFDVELLKGLSEISRVPVIASGGMGTVLHGVELMEQSDVDAVAMGRALHYDRLDIPAVRKAMIEAGVAVRKDTLV